MQEKRRSPRFIVEGVQGKTTFASQVELLNFGLGGVAIKAHRRLSIGAESTLKLELGQESVSVKGVVVWSTLSGIQKVGDETITQYSAGLRFTEPLTGNLRVFLDFFDSA